jgi:hypothetical protein
MSSTVLETPDEDIFIVKPKQQTLTQANKRRADENLITSTPKRRQLAAFVRDASTASTSLGRASVLPYHRRTESRTPSTFMDDRY